MAERKTEDGHTCESKDDGRSCAACMWEQNGACTYQGCDIEQDHHHREDPDWGEIIVWAEPSPDFGASEVDGG